MSEQSEVRSEIGGVDRFRKSFEFACGCKLQAGVVQF